MKFIIYLSLLFIGLQVHCHHIPGHHDEQKSLSEHRHHHLGKKQTIDCHKLPDFNRDFAFKLYSLVSSDQASKNIFFSPLSISIVFSMLALGAKSETQSQIYKGLAFNLSAIEEEEIHGGFQQLIHTLNDPSNTAQITTGNSFFIQESLQLLPKFLEDVDTLYNAEGFTADFMNATAAEKQINNYVANKTNGKIAHAVEDLDSSTVMVLLNYIFFKADWKKPFSSDLISKEDFFVDENTVVKVDLLNRLGYYKYIHDEDLSCWVVEVPYKGDDVTAWFILPDGGKLRDVEDALSKRTMSKWEKSFNNYHNINLSIPKLALSGSYDVKDLLQRMGVTDAFSDSANLSGITGEPNLKVSEAIQKAVLDVNERGTEAAAVTVMEIAPRGGQVPTTLKFNRPFMMFLLHKSTCSILFMGKILNPTEK